MENRIKYMRKQKGWTQSKLAEYSEISTEYVKKLEAGKRTPSLKVAKKLADLFGCSAVDELFIAS